jgi:adenosylcobinamide-phosphate synthase
MLIVLLCALLLDYFFADPHRYHPLTGFGQLAQWIEQRLNEVHAAHTSEQKRVNGFIAAVVCLVPAWWLTDFIISDNIIGLLLEIIIVYLALGLNNLKEHARQIADSLNNNDLPEARQALSIMVSRDTSEMTSEAIAKETTEAVLENGNDTVIAILFWFLVLGAPGVVIYSLTSKLDTMWGHKNERYNDFGFVIARFDDLLNYIPARLTALTYAFMGNWQNATRCWSLQGALWETPNAGVVMSAGAGALGVQLGGGKSSHGEHKERPELGCGNAADQESITQACHLINRSTVFWAFSVTVVSIINWL